MLVRLVRHVLHDITEGLICSPVVALVVHLRNHVHVLQRQDAGLDESLEAMHGRVQPVGGENLGGVLAVVVLLLCTALHHEGVLAHLPLLVQLRKSIGTVHGADLKLRHVHPFLLLRVARRLRLLPWGARRGKDV